MSYPGYPDGLRITVGTDPEIDRLLEILDQIDLSARASSLRLQSRRACPTTAAWRLFVVIRSGTQPEFRRFPRNYDLERTSTCRRDRRTTRETDIRLRLDLDGQGRAEVATGIGFLDHMLELFARHALVDLAVACRGDLHVDGHHTTEDVGICLGQAIDRALGDRAGIRRYGHAVLPMDETLVTTAVDLGGRAYWVWNVAMPSPKIGTFDSELVADFWQAVSQPGTDEPARHPAPRPQHPPHQRGRLQGDGPRTPRCARARSAKHRGPLDQGNALSRLAFDRARMPSIAPPTGPSPSHGNTRRDIRGLG